MQRLGIGLDTVLRELSALPQTIRRFEAVVLRTMSGRSGLRLPDVLFVDGRGRRADRHTAFDPLDWLTFVIVVLVGFTACAEFGSYAFVHPVTRRLPQREFIAVEQGLLNTFGRVMPILMPLTLIVAVIFAISVWDEGGWVRGLAGAAVVSLAAAVISTIIVNVPINLATAKWDPASPPADWQTTRARWERFQGVRSWLLLIGFVLICACVAARLDS